MNEENNAAAVETAKEADVFPLDDAALESLAQFDQQEQQIMGARIGVLTLFTRIHKLQGNWQLAQNRRELVKKQG
jgi:hypothetical protein